LLQFNTVERTNRKLCGHVCDHTRRHGRDNRIWSPALEEHRDLYVYLPPGFDPAKRYPVMIWCHGFLQDEHTFLDQFVVPFDRAIACGKLPPMIIAAPDGSIRGRVSLLSYNSFFLNSKAGRFEDYLIEDVWGFLVANYPIRPEREAHVLAGMSMGGFAAFNQSMKHPEMFKTAIGICPPLNLRWVDCRCRYFGNFDPCCWGWRTSVDRGYEAVGRFACGLITIRLKQLIDPLYGRGPEAVAALSRENPIELLEQTNVVDGQFHMFVAYGGKDEFNIDAQAESFLYVARQRGLTVTAVKDPRGRHNVPDALKFLPALIDWLGPRIADYGPIDDVAAPLAVPALPSADAP
jgi:S-formylglutathione hydrolase FrmB